MTRPYERTRSVVQAQEFLVELSRDTTLPEPIRNEARRLLRH
ncbi:BPSL0761 family protein [Pseudomonas protegens]